MPQTHIDFIGIGVEKAATYWITNILREHPEICFSKNKELAFFGEFDQHFLKVKNPRYERGIDWYLKYFDHCSTSSLKGEFTPTYLYSEKAAQRIKKHFPDVKLIVCLRNPTERAFSQYLHDTSTGVIKNEVTFENAIKQYKSYVEKGYYYKYLRIYLKYFPKKNIFVTTVDEIKKNNRKVAKNLYAFLNLKDTSFIAPSIDKKSNIASNARFARLNYFLLQCEYFLTKNKLNFIHKFLEDTGLRKLIFLFSYKINRKPITKYPKMSEKTEKKLRKIYVSDIQKLEKLLGKNLKEWK